MTDIETVIQDTGLFKYHLLGYSRGASYALEFAQENENQIETLTLILIDYPPEHRQMQEEWAEGYINNYLVPLERLENSIRSQAVWGIQQDSSQTELENKSEIPALVVRGLLDGSLITDIDLKKYKEIFTDITVEEFANSGHDIRAAERENYFIRQ